MTIKQLVKEPAKAKALKKPRDIRIKYQAQDLKFDAQLMGQREAYRLMAWAAHVYAWKRAKAAKKSGRGK